MRQRNELRGVLCLLIVLAVVTLAYDLWEVVTVQVEVKKHLPFLFPVFLGAFAGMVWYTQHWVTTQKTTS